MEHFQDLIDQMADAAAEKVRAETKYNLLERIVKSRVDQFVQEVDMTGDSGDELEKPTAPVRVKTERVVPDHNAHKKVKRAGKKPAPPKPRIKKTVVKRRGVLRHRPLKHADPDVQKKAEQLEKELYNELQAHVDPWSLGRSPILYAVCRTRRSDGSIYCAFCETQFPKLARLDDVAQHVVQCEEVDKSSVCRKLCKLVVKNEGFRVGKCEEVEMGEAEAKDVDVPVEYNEGVLQSAIAAFPNPEDDSTRVQCAKAASVIIPADYQLEPELSTALTEAMKKAGEDKEREVTPALLKAVLCAVADEEEQSTQQDSSM